MNIGEKIAYIVKFFEDNNKSEFSEKIGMPRKNNGLVNSWIVGKAKPKHDYRAKICAAYASVGVTSEWLNDDNTTLSPPLPSALHGLASVSSAPASSSPALPSLLSAQDALISALQGENAALKSENALLRERLEELKSDLSAKKGVIAS